MDKKIQKRTWTWQRILLILGVVAAVSFMGSKLYKQSGTSRLNVQTERLMMDTVQMGSFQEFIPVTGTVLPLRSVVLTAVEGGKVEQKFVEDGAMVKAGQVILKLSNPDLMANYLNQEGSIVAQINQIRNTALLMDQQSLNLKEQSLQVEYQIELVNARLRRNRALAKDQVISRVELEEMEAEYNNLLRRRTLLNATLKKDSSYQELQVQQMDNSLDLMNRNLSLSKQSLDNLMIKAPIDGQLSGLNNEIGETVSKGASIAQIDDLSRFKVRVRIDEYYISRIFLEQEGTLTFANEDYSLKISKIYPQVTNGAFEADMIFTGKNPKGIKRGQSFSVRLELSTKEKAMLLARGGFFQSTGGNWVYVLDPATGNAVKRTIRLGRQNPNYYEVLEGLQVGETVVVSGYDNYGDKDVLVLQ